MDKRGLVPSVMNGNRGQIKVERMHGYGKVGHLERPIHQPLITTCEEVGFLPGFYLEGVQ